MVIVTYKCGPFFFNGTKFDEVEVHLCQFSQSMQSK